MVVPRFTSLAGLALGLALASGAVAQEWAEPNAALKPGNYDCTTRNGRVLEGRGFTIVDSHRYTKGDGPGGVYKIQGNKVYFDLGELDGKQVRILSTGRIKYSSDIFCIYAGRGPDEMIPETPDGTPAPADGTVPADAAAPATAPADAAAPPSDGSAPAPADGTGPAAAQPAEPVPPKVIKVDPSQPTDPRVTPVNPP